MRRLVALLAVVIAFSCSSSEPPHEAVRPLRRVDFLHPLKRTIDRNPGTAFAGAMSGNFQSWGASESRIVRHSEWRIDVHVPEPQAESFLRELCRQLGFELEDRVTSYRGGFPYSTEGSEVAHDETDGYRDRRCDYYAERDGIVGWLSLPAPFREGDVLHLRLVAFES